MGYGKFFLDWYFGSLKEHGSAVLAAAHQELGSHVGVAGKVAGIHWWYNSPHHAAELTAGYYNTNGRNAYQELSRIFKTAGAALDFTCLEMRDSEQQASCKSHPQELVGQVISAASQAGIQFNGENALPRFDDAAYNQILSYKSSLAGFTYLRLGNQLLERQ